MRKPWKRFWYEYVALVYFIFLIGATDVIFITYFRSILWEVAALHVIALAAIGIHLLRKL